MLRAIDTHAHLDFPEYDPDRSALMKSLDDEGIGVITISTNEASWSKVDKLSRDNPSIWGAIGLHPCEIGPETLINLNGLMNGINELVEGNDKLVAIGEIGLDYYHSTEHVGDQKVIFSELLRYSLEKKIPVILHCRNAYGDMLTILRRYPGLKGVVHCYSGSLRQAKEYLDLGLHISFTGMLTYKSNSELREISKIVPMDRLLLETDAPFLSPQSSRGQRNTPKGILEIAQMHSEIRGVPLDEILRETTNNAKQLFGLDG